MNPPPDEHRPQEKSREIPFPLSLLFIPFLLIGTILSYPYGAVSSAFQRRKARRFVQDMSQANRVMTWPLFAKSLDERRGTLIVEALSSTGPTRWWWTSDDITTESPYRFAKTPFEAVLDSDGVFNQTCQWCHERYTGSQGKALLVLSSAVPETTRRMRDESPVITIARVVVSGAAILHSRRR
jgi:hypothetical protein